MGVWMHQGKCSYFFCWVHTFIALCDLSSSVPQPAKEVPRQERFSAMTQHWKCQSTLNYALIRVGRSETYHHYHFAVCCLFFFSLILFYTGMVPPTNIRDCGTFHCSHFVWITEEGSEPVSLLYQRKEAVVPTCIHVVSKYDANIQAA